MKYTLLVGIEYKSFRQQPADITVSINDRLIDCFTLDKDHGTIENVLPQMHDKWFNECGRSHWINQEVELYSKAKGKRHWQVKLPKCIKAYQIDADHLQGNLKIKVDNDNSDYTNGFMKNSSLICMSMIALFPSHMSGNHGEKLMKTMIKLDTAYWLRSWPDTPEGNQIEEARVRDIQIKHNWPLVDSFFVRRESNLHDKSKQSSVQSYIGGSFTAEIPVEKKHKVFFLRSPSSDTKGFFLPNNRSLAVGSYKPLLNIYNEDQRSNS
tara:strand:- start:383 stop:1183 length:801 start_codon:yes stop_codon:yes gene_type:complete